MRLNARSRTLIVTAAALTFVLAGSAVAIADTGDASDHPDAKKDRVAHRTDRHRDRPADRPHDRVVDRPDDRPVDRPIDRPTDRPDRDDRRSIWRRCLQAAQSDQIGGDESGDEAPEFRKVCHRLLWKHNAWKRCLHWAAEHTDLDVENRRELWKLCHRLLWNHQHAQ